MGATPSPPGEALAALRDALGGTGAVRPLSDRRGTRVWKVQGHQGAVALKANVPGEEETRDKAAEMAQEDGHLRRLAEAEVLSSGYRVGAGPWEGGHWLAVRWVDGVPMWRALALARGPEGERRSVRPWLLGVARGMAARLESMHAAGWTHADVQPTNTLIGRDGRAELIDFALACGPGGAARLPYRGALTHTTAPEIADAVLTTTPDTHVQAEPLSDVWGLGAALFWCWTGYRPVDYEDEAPREDKLRAIARGEVLSLDCVRPWPFPELEEVVRACLTVDPERRPSARELAGLIPAV
ncbi:protein kinase [Streptomyces albidoflavus]